MICLGCRTLSTKTVGVALSATSELSLGVRMYSAIDGDEASASSSRFFSAHYTLWTK